MAPAWSPIQAGSILCSWRTWPRKNWAHARWRSLPIQRVCPGGNWRALEIAERFCIPVRVIQTQEFNNPDYLANPNNRCYFCKQELLPSWRRWRGKRDLPSSPTANASDIGEYRPGAKAAAEFQVRAPLKEAGLTKAEIRELSAQLGLPTADKPQLACLSSRIPTANRSRRQNC